MSMVGLPDMAHHIVKDAETPGFSAPLAPIPIEQPPDDVDWKSRLAASYSDTA